MVFNRAIFLSFFSSDVFICCFLKNVCVYYFYMWLGGLFFNASSTFFFMMLFILFNLYLFLYMYQLDQYITLCYVECLYSIIMLDIHLYSRDGINVAIVSFLKFYFFFFIMLFIYFLFFFFCISINWTNTLNLCLVDSILSVIMLDI